MIVEVDQGKLEGITKKSILTGNDYHAFLGIPYAKPPLGELRFQLPQPNERWDGILNAKKEGSPCIQRNFFGMYIGSEDCLYLNVYTPSPPTEDAIPKAVMIFIHGGAYLAGSGSSDFYSPDYLMGYDIVLVTINYRLHALGFLNMETKNNADNCGLRDQCLAFQWVKENIRHFGGNPQNITIFGSSAGASSVFFQTISPKSKGLFNKAIIQSDPVYSFLVDGNTNRQMGFDLAKKLGFNGNDPEKLVEFLKHQSAVEIAKNIPSIFDGEMKVQDRSDLANMFRPTTTVTNDDAFLPDTIENLRKSANPVPLMIGFNNKEGRMAFSIFGDNLLEILQNGFSETILRPYNISNLQFQNICDKIEKQYLSDEPIDDKTAEKVVDVFTDYWFRKFYESFDFIINSEKPVYIYEFTFFGKFNEFDKIYTKNRPASSSGAAHSDEIPYLFYPRQMLPDLKEFCEPETTVIKNMCSLWTNFAKTSNPSENFNGFEWRQYTSEKPCFLQIDRDLKLIEEKLREKEFSFWNELLQ